MSAKKCWILATLGIFIVSVASYIVLAVEPIRSMDDLAFLAKQQERDVLVGLKGIHVGIGEIGSELKKNGLTSDIIQVDAELELRKFGIKVLTEEEWIREKGKPSLYVHLTCFADSSSKFTGTVYIQLSEQVMLARRPEISVLGSTWSRLVTFANADSNNIREVTKQVIDIFINDYLAANPKEPEGNEDANKTDKRNSKPSK